jgi:nucleosome binding factor SPN SPT16 subunit
MEVVIDADRFYARLLALRNKWLSTKSGVFNNADALVIPMGVTTDEELTYSKAAAIHLYLLGYEFSDSLMVLTKTTFYFIATSKKCGYLQLASSKLTQTEIQIQLVNKSKDDIANTDQFMMIINAIKKQNGSKLGSLLKFECKGTFIPLWSKTVEDNKLEVVDISNALGVYLATKDDQEVVCSYLSV